jgi:hypothetical protein
VHYAFAGSDEGTRIDLEDVSIEDATVLPDFGGVALVLLDGTLEADRVRIESVGGGAAFLGRGAVGTVRDLEIRQAGEQVADIAFALGATGPETMLNAERVRIDGTQGFGLVAVAGATVIASDVVIRDVQESECTDCPGQAGTAIANSAESRIEVRRFLVESAALAGLQLLNDQFVVENGTIRGSTIGVNLQAEGIDPSRFATLVLEDNIVDLDARTLPVPEPTVPEIPEAGL